MNCKEFHRKAASDELMSLLTRLDYRLHTWICHVCRGYLRQLRQIGRQYRRLIDQNSLTQEIRVRELEERIISDWKSKTSSK